MTAALSAQLGEAIPTGNGLTDLGATGRVTICVRIRAVTINIVMESCIASGAEGFRP
ncbi:hypothetical protein [Streptomyces sp. Ncost-T10-10d]|uniref:hypothetical protein n=1 Tax=Streptomyces sp. Ncost-T10-10d TaxID=1839774 RepID=UPI00081D7B75|nr:hypothetical protein [Streptomyces sp. Ncost-T10-10d]SCF81331.1 hypothetical protein GA0115254_117811 [Streptomyces sp. Ncost-T10-10d]